MRCRLDTDKSGHLSLEEPSYDMEAEAGPVESLGVSVRVRTRGNLYNHIRVRVLLLGSACGLWYDLLLLSYCYITHCYYAVYIYIYICLCIYVCVYIHIYIYTCMIWCNVITTTGYIWNNGFHVRIYIYIYVYVLMYAYINIYIHTYVYWNHVYIYIYIYIYIFCLWRTGFDVRLLLRLERKRQESKDKTND